MDGGANSIKEGRSALLDTRIQEPQKAVKEGTSTFQKVLSKGNLKAPGDPKTYFAGLGKVTQSGDLSFSQRVEAFRVITEQVITHPSNPYSKIEKEVREEMIESVAETLADSPRPLPRTVKRVG
jgi:hypothetical protein